MKYALLFDLGNTNIKIGLADKKSLFQSFSLPSGNAHTADSLGLMLLQLIRHAGREQKDLGMALACSVVPGLNPILRLACARFCNLDLRFVPEDIPVGLENRYAQPTQVGADRLVGAYAARMLYPEPASLICIDYGTATTFDCVEGNAYLGGLICPGVLSSADALASRTAKLPAVSLETNDLSPRPGTSTSTSINHGFLFGFAAMTEGLCAKLAQNLKAPRFILATGGFSANLAKVTPCFDALRADLLLEGLRIIYAQQSEN